MIDFIPIHNYTYYFDITILCMILVAVWQCHTGNILQKNIVNLNAIWGVIFISLLIPYMGLRPISIVFGDTVNYAHQFDIIRNSKETWEIMSSKGEWIFSGLQYWFALNSDIHSFFLLCAAIYIIPLWLAMIRLFKNYYYIPFLISLSAFTFWDYGVNGVRNGMAASLVILALTYVNKWPLMLLLCGIAIGIHKSLLLIVVAGILGWYYKNTAIYVVGWIFSIGFSAIFGTRVSNLLLNLGLIQDDRFVEYVTSTEEMHQFSYTGFRWDFLLYSALPVAIGYFFIFKRHFKDEYYSWIYNIYLIANAFWIIVIRAEFSNRFAQISWFIMPLVLIYPFMKERFWKNHEKNLGIAILIFYAYTFFETFIQ